MNQDRASTTTNSQLKEGYKQTEVGVIPEDWSISTVGEEFSIQLGKMLDADKNIGTLKPYLGNRSIQWGHIEIDNISIISLTPSDIQRFRLKKGDLLVCEGGESGRAAIWNNQINECYYQKALHRLRPTRGYNVFLMLCFLQRWVSTGFLSDFITQTSIAHLPKEKFEQVPLIVPPLLEQEAIACTLSDIDALIESLDRILIKKRQIKQGAMQELLRSKDGWIERRLGDISHIQTGSRNNQDKVEDGEYPLFVRSATVERINTYSYDCEAILIPGEGGIGSIFHYINGRFDAHQRVYVIREFSEEISGKYVYLYMSKKFGFHAMQNSVKATVDSLRLPTFQNFQIFVPPTLEEQIEIASILSDMDAEIGSIESKLTKTRQLKQGMMHELLTGRIRLVD